MKIILLGIAVLLLLISPIYAEFVYLEDKTNLVLAVAEKDCLSFPGHKFRVIEMNVPGLEYDVSLYRYENGKFIIDKNKVNSVNKANREFNIHILAKTEIIKLGYELLLQKGLATKEEVDKNMADIVKMRNAKLKPIIQIEEDENLRKKE